MIERLTWAMQSQNISQEKIDFIIGKLSNSLDGVDDNGHWDTFCKSCLEVGIDPQAVFALAVTDSEDGSGSQNLESI